LRGRREIVFLGEIARDDGNEDRIGELFIDGDAEFDIDGRRRLAR
jgi:hypothetical protein